MHLESLRRRRLSFDTAPPSDGSDKFKMSSRIWAETHGGRLFISLRNFGWRATAASTTSSTFKRLFLK